MKKASLQRAFTWLESGPVVLVTSRNGEFNDVCAISWHMVMDFSPRIAITTGPWNRTFTNMLDTGECMICVAGADLLDRVIAAGTMKGGEFDKVDRIGLTAFRGSYTDAPGIGECLACIECRIEAHFDDYGIIVFRGVELWENDEREEKRLCHANGDGTFTVDGETVSGYRDAMSMWIPDGCERL